MKLTTLVLIISLFLNPFKNMGIFNSFFGNKQDIQITSELLDEELFWKIVEKSNPQSNNLDSQESILVKELSKLTPKQIIGFRLMTDKLLHNSYNSEMWCAGYIMNYGCSDDGFEYFRLWVISRGKETYYSSLKNPDYLIKHVDTKTEWYEFESFWYVALEAFNKKTGKELYDYIDEDNHKYSESKYPSIEFNWSDEKPESMKAICPKLYDKFSN